MSAPNIAALLDFEGNFEAAVTAVLTAALNSAAPVYIAEQAQKMAFENAAVGFDLGPAIEELEQIPKPDNWPADTPAPQDYFRYTGVFTVRIEVVLDQNTATLAGLASLAGQLRGLIRAAFMRSVMPFTDANLPYYRVSDIRPNGTNTGTLQTRNTFFTELRFLVTFAIQPAAWPAWVTS